jgi:DNA-directed RNA polymerase subunit M
LASESARDLPGHLHAKTILLEKLISLSKLLHPTHMFCPKCQSLMFPRNGKMVCGNDSCGYARDIIEGDNSVTKVANRTKVKPMETLVLDGITETLPKTNAECPKCGHLEAFWIMRQTRAADEPTTRIYRCAKCGHTWREY